MSRRCHYIYDKEAGKVLIPGCWNVVHSRHIENCTCRVDTIESNRIEKLKSTIKELEKENARLYRIIKKINFLPF